MRALLDYFRIHSTRDAIILGFGVLGQSIFAIRFLVQWIVSERRRESTIPLAFWYLSLVGAIMVLVYGVLKGELLLIIGPLPGCVIYIRNLMLLRRTAKIIAEREAGR